MPVVSAAPRAQVQEMAAVGKKYGIPLIALGLGHVDGNAARRRDPLDRNPAGARREHDDIVTIPRSAAAVGRVAQRLRGTAAGGDFLQLALREESDVAAIGRPERIRGVLGERHRLSLKRIHRTQPELPFSVHRAAMTRVRPSGEMAKL